MPNEKDQNFVFNQKVAFRENFVRNQFVIGNDGKLTAYDRNYIMQPLTLDTSLLWYTAADAIHQNKPQYNFSVGL